MDRESPEFILEGSIKEINNDFGQKCSKKSSSSINFRRIRYQSDCIWIEHIVHAMNKCLEAIAFRWISESSLVLKIVVPWIDEAAWLEKSRVGFPEQ